jgi:aldose 1-epimerase
VLSTETKDDYASVVLNYEEHTRNQGFPYTYNIQLEYILTESTLKIVVEIKNTDIKTFPFTLGWHPYFLSSDLYNSAVRFNSSKKLRLDDRNITEGIEVFENKEALKVMDKSLDDCYFLSSKNVEFLTPKYSLNLTTSEENSFLQLYTPPYKNTIAIEPTTGVSDSFNNGIGLKTLGPKEVYKIEWCVKLKYN